jgi:UDP-glucose-4-epimerase GalE
MENKTALITGCAGYLGSHLAKSLKKQGWTVVGLGHNRETTNQYIDVVHYADIRDESELNFLFDHVKVDVVFHLAGRIEAGVSFQEPIEFWSVNCGGTTTLLSAMKRAGVQNIVFSSTAAVYKAQNRPIVEDDEKADNSPYGYSKISAEQAIRHSGMNYTIFRYFNLTGADPDGEFGESHEPETHLIPRLLLNLNNFEINGTDYNTPDGTCIRDYVHVSDIADAHSKAGEMLLNGEYKAETMNLGTGKGSSILDIITELEKITNQKITYKVNPRRSGDADSLIADISLAKKLLNYQPKYDIISMLQTAYDWQKNNG